MYQSAVSSSLALLLRCVLISGVCSRVQLNKAKGIMVPFEDFREEFQSRVTSIGHILAMMAPWDCPVYVTRVRPFIFNVLAHTIPVYL